MDNLFEYKLDSAGNAEITKYLGTETEVTVPSELDGHRVTAFGHGVFHFCTELMRVQLPEGLTSIPDGTFQYCKSLKTVRIPQSVTSIGRWAFSNCKALQNINLPDSVTSIGVMAFSNAGLKKIRLPKGLRRLEEKTFWKCEKLKDVQLNEGLTIIGKEAFKECGALRELHIPDSVTRIESGAFSYCKATVHIPKSVTDIDTWAFTSEMIVVGEKGSVAEHRCKTYKTRFVEQGAQMIRENGMTFQLNADGTAQLAICRADETKICIPESVQGHRVTQIGDSVFLRNSAVKTLLLPESITKIGGRAFWYCTSLVSIAFPRGIRHIPAQLCEGCSNLTLVEIPEGVVSIGTRAFNACEALKKITLPGSVTSIGECAFGYCKALRDVSLPEGLQELQAAAFCDCNALKTIQLPRSLTSIGRVAFHNCKSLTTVSIPGTIQHIGEKAFGEDFESNRKLRIVTDNPQAVMAASVDGLNVPVVAENGEESGLLFALNTDGTVDVLKWDSKEKSVTIPGTYNGRPVVGIRKEAFMGCNTLQEVRISEGVTRIESGAFYGCMSLKRVELPSTIRDIADNAFAGCRNLGLQDNSVDSRVQTVVDSYYHVTYELRKDGAYAVGYSGGRGLVEIWASCKGRPVIGIAPGVFRGDNALKQVWIRNGVREIGSEAFAGCSQLYELKIPASVTCIGENAIPHNGPMEMLDPYCAYALQQDPWSRKEYGVYDPAEPVFIQRNGVTVITTPGSCAARYCKKNGIACEVKNYI